ncbi:protease HtpX [Aestuariirhabdus litorea]|uniref:Protease HtpX n=1 Tax=Aestuariirhabdus litorea TaxID=2528527 RepID=A0A3P3VPE1_9GAMM|nr:protease HtpX [Aestuariirhabdus litorea]RRJ84470.1 protease HtpX [Aestuariirhabdus litorea]RWW97694.1 protease HtpX [Endozoicomonadaceae bacterium GTF-13]
MMRIGLFLITNLAVLLVLSIVMSLFGVDGRSTTGLLMIAAAFGFGGSLISLALSKTMALRSTGAKVIETPANSTERWLLETVSRQAKAAGIGMPQVAIYPAEDINAFATGMKRDDALVAVSTGLLNNMSQDEAEAVLGHEVSHIANGDMVTLALIQGVVNTFVIFIARIIANIISSVVSQNNEEGEGLGMFAYMGVVFVLEMLFGILASIVVAFFSRQREFRADIGGAQLAGREKMIAALERLRNNSEPHLEGSLVAFGINGKKSMAEFFMSHPPLEKRIAALRSVQ